jgi:hypothetical protein
MVWKEDQTSYHIPLGQRQIQSKTMTHFNSTKVGRNEEAAEDKCEASRVGP